MYSNDDCDTDAFIGISSKNTRLGFIRKVYCIVSLMLGCASAAIIISSLSKEYRDFISRNIWLLIVSLIVNIISVYALVCYKSVARTFPKNYIWLSIFTVTESYYLSHLPLAYTGGEMIIAASLTALMVFSLTLYAMTTKTDFTTCGAFLFVFCFMLFVSGIAMFCVEKTFYGAILYSFLGILCFSLYLIYDTQLLIGGHSFQYSMDDYIVAALQIFIDIIRIFLEILKIVAAANR